MWEKQESADFRGQPRLPQFAAPRRYDVFLKPDLSTCDFSGSAAITVDDVSPTRFLVLNSAYLSVDVASVSLLLLNSSRSSISPRKTEVVEEDEILVVEFDSQLPLGQSLLQIRFTGTLNDDQMRGFYRSKYEYKGDVKNMAVMQFEAVDARSCFPCWDEPTFKAQFKITLVVPSQLLALSNIPVSSHVNLSCCYSYRPFRLHSRHHT